MPTNRHANKRIQMTIYKLKRLYGAEIFVYEQGNPQTDLSTGIKSWPNKTVTRVDRAIILPVKLTREQTQTISMISSDKQFVYGGMYDISARWFYIDHRDLPSGYEIKRDSWIVYDGKQYEIKEIQKVEFNTLLEVLAVELKGVVPQQIHVLTGKSMLDIQQDSSGTFDFIPVELTAGSLFVLTQSSNVATVRQLTAQSATGLTQQASVVVEHP